MQQPDPDPHEPEPAPTTQVVVIVVRTGGVAGLRREWRAEPSDDEASRWIALIEDCPWDDATASPEGADRFIWRIDARFDDRPPREARLGDRQLDGPWRTLVDEVRVTAGSRPAPPRRG